MDEMPAWRVPESPKAVLLCSVSTLALSALHFLFPNEALVVKAPCFELALLPRSVGALPPPRVALWAAQRHSVD